MFCSSPEFTDRFLATLEVTPAVQLEAERAANLQTAA